MKTITLCIVAFFAIQLAIAQELLVDFGSDAASNTYNTMLFPGWEQVSISTTTHYMSMNGVNGTGLLVASPDSNQYTNFTCITGLPRQFLRGERVLLHWFNYTELPFEFNPLVSFTDIDNPVNEAGEPQWFIVNLSGSYWVEPGETLVVFYDITDQNTCSPMLPPSAGLHSHLNVSVNTFEPGLILDKIYIGVADTTAPGIPQLIQVNQYDAHSIGISWSQVSDNPGGDGLSHYEIIINGHVFGISQQNQFTAHLLEPSTNYTIALRSVDMANNKSALSNPISQTTAPPSYPDYLINPANQLSYLGAFRLPEGGIGTDFNYMESDLTYHPYGDPSNNDPFPGSLFVAGDATHRMVSEINIPIPVISTGRVLDDIPFASFLQGFADISSPNIQYAEWGWKRGPALEFLEAQNGQDQHYLYTCHGEYYAMDGERFNSYGASRTVLSAPYPYGGWVIGPADGFAPPHYMSLLNFLFAMPNPINTHLLVAGGSRPGFFHNGPSLIAFSPWNHGLPLPPDNTNLDYTTLLLYDDDYGSNFLNGQGYCDYWYGGAWLSSGNKHSVVVSGLKGRGREWYGYNNGESTFNIMLNVPEPFEPEDKGPRQSYAQALLVFYNPEELTDVASGTVPSWQPQPYAAFDPTDVFFFPNDFTPSYISAYKGAGGMAFDRERQIIYLLERGVTGLDHSVSVVHAWKIENPGTSVGNILIHKPSIIFNGQDLCISQGQLNDPATVSVFTSCGQLIHRFNCQNINLCCEHLQLPAGFYVVQLKHKGIHHSQKIIVKL